MKPLDTLKNIANVQMMRYKAAGQKGQITKLQNQVQRLQHLVKDDILTLTEKTTKYRGNEYTSYTSAVQEISKKYNGNADWGVLQTGNIIDLRAAFIINEGLKIVKKTDDADAEYEWVKRFFEYNDLDKEMSQEFAKEAEIEGKLALKIIPEEVSISDKDEKETMISVRFITWTDKKYTIETDPQDYMKFIKLKWQPKDKDKPEILKEDEFVYKKFGGRINKPNSPTPKIMKCLTQIENLDKALRDWREINRIFAGPILYISVNDANEAKVAQEATSEKNWKIKKVIVTTGELKYAQFDIKGVESLENEILTLCKMISGQTGIPVHFLGPVELMSNRATAENLMEMVNAATSKDRETWKGAYEEIIRKAMIMYNGRVNQGMSKERQLDPDKIGIDIPVITKEQWEHLEKVLLPAAIAGKVSDEFFQEKIPGLDMDVEQKRKQDKESSELEQIKHENEDLKTDLNDKELFGGGGNAT